MLHPIAVLAITLTISLCVQTAAPAKGDALVIEKQGDFYVGGRSYDTPEGPVVADRMYVEFQIPEKKTKPYPIVLFHGGDLPLLKWSADYRSRTLAKAMGHGAEKANR